mmetsp:Transcript_21256/g.47104  ORF Transcript_21256/g.47104 Transcript_21256/m.47104 type:complete len:283 (-) Transcript_21256:2378-3226(-)
MGHDGRSQNRNPSPRSGRDRVFHSGRLERRRKPGFHRQRWENTVCPAGQQARFDLLRGPAIRRARGRERREAHDGLHFQHRHSTRRHNGARSLLELDQPHRCRRRFQDDENRGTGHEPKGAREQQGPDGLGRPGPERQPTAEQIRHRDLRRRSVPAEHRLPDQTAGGAGGGRSCLEGRRQGPRNIFEPAVPEQGRGLVDGWRRHRSRVLRGLVPAFLRRWLRRHPSEGPFEPKRGKGQAHRRRSFVCGHGYQDESVVASSKFFRSQPVDLLANYDVDFIRNK